MDTNILFEKYKRRFRRIGIFKSLLWGLILGFGVETIVAFCLWFFHMSVPIVLLIMLGTLTAVTLFSAPLFYLLFHRPTNQKIARFIDRLGLEERLVTMCDYEEEETEMARIQRKDAQEKLSDVNEKQIICHFSRAAVLVLAVSISFGLTMSVVSTLSAGGVISGGNEVFSSGTVSSEEESKDEDDMCIITYSAGEGGTIQGEAVQRLERGADTTPVTAVAKDGFEFVGWSDGDPRPTRIDYAVQESKTILARFAKKILPDLPEGDAGIGVEGGEGQGPGIGGDAALGGGAGGSGNGGESQGEDENGSAGGGAGMVGDKEDNSVIDGYRDFKNEFEYDSRLEELLKDDSISDDLKNLLNLYLDALKELQESE